LRTFMLAVLAVFLLQPSFVQPATGALVSVIVREDSSSGSLPEETIEHLGGDVGRHIDIIDGFAATLPSGGLEVLRATSGVTSVTPNAPVKLQSSTYDANSDPGSMYNLINSIKGRDLWRLGYTGRGVDVALIDSGVAPVDGLTTAGKVINGPDLSFEGANPNVQYLDTFGHGTHLAGIIAGRSNATTTDTLDGNNNDKETFVGVAPDARIVNVKVANARGATDVSQVLAAIDWVVQHRNDNGMNIRVLNLSFGTDGTQDYRYDPLTYAAEVAWHKGIVVVVAAGNGQFGNGQLNNPAYDPYVLAVGANDTKGTYDTSDDVVPEWSANGDGTRNPDLVAPGKSVQSLRVPGSYVDETYGSTGLLNDRFFRGSGTSQSAAVVSGAAALLLQQRPNLTPDQVKAILKQSATPLPAGDPVAQGSGALDLKTAARMATPNVTQNFERASGTGSLELARGSVHVESPEFEVCEEAPVEGSTETETQCHKERRVLQGEQDAHGSTWDGASWSGASWSGASWSGGEWNGASWAGASWSGASWSGASWSGASWSGASWSGASWSGASWSGASWSGASWSGASWSGASWSGASWSGASWSGASWSGASWSGASWSGASWSGASWSGASWSGASWS
ncbi:MAG: S8 family serine peptidase, partial [Actinomycetota bacterium]